MRTCDATSSVADVGEKFLIEQVLRPLFNPTNDRNLAGDDCAVIEIPPGCVIVASTDRVPADLISFRAGVLDFEHLGRYLGVLNLSDIAACGGVPTALLFNCGLPPSLLVSDLVAISQGLKTVALEFDSRVAGGDVTSASELSLSATAIGYVERSRVLRRSGASPGDSIFVSRQVGITPVALDYCLRLDGAASYTADERVRLEAQFKALTPEIHLGRKLSLSGKCSSCMDNTDGLGQSLSELSRESSCAFVISPELIQLNDLVKTVAVHRGLAALDFALGPGADFSLVGTLAGDWCDESASGTFGADFQIIGRVVEGSGVYVQRGGAMEPLVVRGWNYFSRE